MAKRKTPTNKTPADELLAKFMKELANDSEISKDQQEAANEDMRFVNVPGGMWEDEFEDWENRVKLELDTVSSYVERNKGEWNNNRVGVDYKPEGAGTSPEDSDLLNGIYRADFRNKKGKLSTDNAVDETYTCGTGAFKISTSFVDDEDATNFDQRLQWVPIYNAYNTVMWDSASKMIDKSDARWVTLLTSYTHDSFKEEWPDEKPISAITPNKVFFSNDNMRADPIYIATRYQIVRKRKTVFVYGDIKEQENIVFDSAEHKEKAAEIKANEFLEFIGERKILEQTVEKTVFSGATILSQPRRIAGKHLPIIQFYAYRSYVDGVEYYRGLVRKLKDASRLFNMMASQWAETSASSGQDQPIFLREQVQNPDVAAGLADRNNSAYIVIDAIRSESGEIINPGPVGYLKAPQLDGATVALASTVADYIKGVTGGAPQDTLGPATSGKALKALLKRENMNTQVINDNIANSIAWSGTVAESIIKEIYDTPRDVHVESKQGIESSARLLENVLDEEEGKFKRINVLQGKKFNAYADIGPQYETLQEESVENIKGVIDLLVSTQQGAEYFDAALAALMDNQNGVGLDPLKSIARNKLLVMGAAKPETPEEEALVQQAQQPKEDPQAKLVEAAANQQNSEARSLDASSLQKTADAGKKEAETVKIFADMGNDKRKLEIEAQDQAAQERADNIKVLESFPLEVN